MYREIYEVIAKVIDANGSYNDLNGYPKTFDSTHYEDNCKRTYNRAMGAYNDALGPMYRADTRKLQFATVLRVTDGCMIASSVIGGIEDGNQQD